VAPDPSAFKWTPQQLQSLEEALVNSPLIPRNEALTEQEKTFSTHAGTPGFTIELFRQTLSSTGDRMAQFEAQALKTKNEWHSLSPSKS